MNAEYAFFSAGIKLSRRSKEKKRQSAMSLDFPSHKVNEDLVGRPTDDGTTRGTPLSHFCEKPLALCFFDGVCALDVAQSSIVGEEEI